MAAFFTIGHSTRSLEEFISLLDRAEVRTVVDVRRMPQSKTNPHFNAESLPRALGASGIDYSHLAELGGLRRRRKDGSESPNMFWDNTSFRNYADYAATGTFRTGLEKLLEIGHNRNAAIMCAEALWWQCHRRIITDHLLAARETVLHIVGPGKIEPAQMTDGARVDASGVVTYPALL